MGYPTSLYDSLVDDISLAELKAKKLNDATYSHSVVHRADAAEVIAIETKIGTGSSTATANTVLGGSGAGTSAWTATPTLTTLETTGNLTVGGSLSLADDLTFANTKGVVFQKAATGADCSILEDASDNLIVKVGSASKSLHLEDSAGAEKVTLDTQNSLLRIRDGYKLRINDSTDADNLDLYHDGTDSFVESGVGNLVLKSASDFRLEENNKKLYFQNAAVADDCSIYEDTTDNINIKVGTALKNFLIRDSVDDVKVQIDTSDLSLKIRDGYGLRIYEGTDTNYIKMETIGATGDVTAVNGNLRLSGNNKTAGPIFMQLAAAPSGSNGMVYYDTTLHKLRVYANSTWTNLH